MKVFFGNVDEEEDNYVLAYTSAFLLFFLLVGKLYPRLLGGTTNTWEKKSLKFNGCPIQSHFFCHKDFKTVFIFFLAQLEGSSQKKSGFNQWEFQWENDQNQ